MKQQMPEIKRHFKMYKSGKLWLVAGITAASLMVGGQAASAADNGQPSQPTTTAATTPTDQPKTETATDKNQSGADTTKTDTTTTSDSAQAGSTTTDQGNKANANQDANQPAKDDGTTKETVDGGNVLVTTKDGQVSLQDKDGKPVSGVKTINGKTYSFDAQGKAQTGLKTIDGKTYNFGTNGVAQTGVFTLDGKTYSFGKDGIAQTGLQTVDGKVYDFDEKTAVAKTGWQVIKDSKYYFDEKTGVAKTGWQTIDGNKYYFNPKTGAAYVGWAYVDNKLTYFTKDGVNVQHQVVQGDYLFITYADGKVGLLKPDGSPASGWFTNNNQKYYFKDGKAVTGWQTIENQNYYFNKDGVVQTGLQTIENKLYFFNKDGVAQTGLKEVGQDTYLFAEKGFAALQGLQEFNGKTYYFEDETSTKDKANYYKMVKNRTITVGSATYHFDDKGMGTQTGQVILNNKGTLKQEKDGNWYLYDAKGEKLTGWQKLDDKRIVYFALADGKNITKGQMIHGEYQIGDKWYFFDTKDGNLVRGLVKLADGRHVYYDVDENGNGHGMLHGLVAVKDAKGNTVTYMVRKDNGDLLTGFQTDAGKSYFFDAKTFQAVTNTEMNIDGHWRFFGKDGVMATGFTKLGDGRLVYYNQKGWMLYGEQQLNGNWYNFRTDNGDASRGFTKLGKRTVYYDLNEDGTGRGMLHGIAKVGDKTYSFRNDNGDQQTGFMYNPATKNLNFFDPKQKGALVLGTVDEKGNQTKITINGKSYVVDKDGNMILNDGENQLNGNWYLYDANKKQVSVGFIKLKDGRTVYYDETTAAMVHGEKKIKGAWYHFNQWNGDMSKGFTRLNDGRTVYYDQNGRMKYGEQQIGGQWYYFRTNNGDMVRGWFTMPNPDKRTVYYDNGKMVHGFTKINGWLVHFNESDGNLTRYAYVWYNGQRYYARPDGGLTRA